MADAALLSTLFIDFNSYFACAEQHDDRRLRGRPVGVIAAERETPNAVCIAVSYEARGHGVGTGTRVREAREKCPDIIFRQARHDRYVDLHHELRTALEAVLPVEKAWSVDEFACRLTGPDRRLPAAMALAEAVKASIEGRVGVTLRNSIGLGANRLLAKIACGLKKPDGLSWILPGEEAAKLAPLSLTRLPGINRRMEARLHRAGVHDVPALLTLPPRQARMIWGGVQGERFVRALRGEALHDFETTRGMIGHSQILAPEVRPPAEARLVARRLLVKAAARLRRMGYFSARLSLGLRTEGRARRGAETGFAATQDTLVLLRRLDDLWARAGADREWRLFAVSVTLGRLMQDGAHQLDLFDEARPAAGAPTAREALFHAIDGINRRHGRDTVRIGPQPKALARYTGVKIAFNRVPEAVERME